MAVDASSAVPALSTPINAETLTKKCPHSIAVPVAVNRTRE